MRSASMLLASSGMLPMTYARTASSSEAFALEIDELSAGWLATCQRRASRMLALPNPAALLTRSRHRDHEFAVLLGDEVFGAAG